MNRTKLKNYAPLARRDFIQVMTDRGAYYGLTATKIEPVVERGDVAVIAGREHARAVVKKRLALEDRIQRAGFEQTMEALAYTWFNRLVAIRYMELHGYLDHGYRVLSHPEGKPTPEILEHAEHVDLPGLKKEAVIDLKLAGNKEGELYRLLLTAKCNALHAAMPFLFEKIDDETELLLPDNLLHSDSLIRKLVGEIDEEEWQQVEIIGWLYQFYISERKDEVIGKVVASEDIPAATQLFTPNWIVKYLVQNTLGRQWLATYPQSALRKQMEYYIEPTEQTPDVQAHLTAITPTSLNPEELTLLDPACGSGHILVEGYDLFKAIYQERGYRAKDIPALILQKNLFGLEIDDRAAQLAAFALMMKARADDRHVLNSDARPNILAFQNSKGMNAAEITHALNAPINKEGVPTEHIFEEIDEEKAGLFSKNALAEKGHVSHADIASLLALFENAKTFGSLIQVPAKFAVKLPEIERRLKDVLTHGDLIHASAKVIQPLLQQAELLGRQYDTVVANPPYMSSNFFATSLKTWVIKEYRDTKADTCVAFIERAFHFGKSAALVGMVTMQSWMFLSGFQRFRESLLQRRTIYCMAHLGPFAFPQIGGQVVQVTAFVVRPFSLPYYRGSYRRLLDGSSEEKGRRLHTATNYTPSMSELGKLPECPLAYWANEVVRDLFQSAPSLGEVAAPRQGMATTNNALFLRLWFEVDCDRIGFGVLKEDECIRSQKKWFPFNKGGPYRKWFGNNEYVVNYENNGKTICDYIDNTPGARVGSSGRVINRRYYFKEGITWTAISAGDLSVRYDPPGSIFSNAGMKVFAEGCADARLFEIAGFLNSSVASELLSCLSETVNFDQGLIARLPILSVPDAVNVVRDLVELSRADWKANETAWDFDDCHLTQKCAEEKTMSQSFARWEIASKRRIDRSIALEQHNNQLFIDAYGLKEQLSPLVQAGSVSLAIANRLDDLKKLLSYALGCMMGRYSLDKPGLIYAHGGNQGFDPGHYKSFRADDDGIIPLLQTAWGIRDDATNRLVDFVAVAWPKEYLEENLKFIADSLGPNNGEQPRETIRRYLATGFYKHHLSTYKRRPIYWLFNSGKQRSFQCLVYLHRYHEGTLARMRTEYVIPLQAQIAARIEQLEGDKAKATSTSHRNKIQKEQDRLKKQQAELAIFEEKLKHAADQKISLDLDDGVKANYAKFGDLVAEAKAVTGGKGDE